MPSRGESRRDGGKGPPPVHLWNPPFCGDLDMRIAADGTWYYLEDADRPAGAGQAVRLGAQARGRQLFSGHAGREGAESSSMTRRSSRSSSRSSKRPARPASCISAPMSTTGSRAAPEHRAALRAGSGHRRAEALSACAARSVGQGDAARCSTILWRSARSARSAGARMFGVASGGEFFAMAPADSLRDFA